MAVKKHHHAVPVALAMAGLLVLAAVAISHLTSGQYIAARALTTQVVNVHPTKNGLSEITTSQPAHAGSDWTQAGASASLNLSLQ
ncbi:MAG TPA: hypothetical protein VLG27_02880 [Candidatus Saccharimonadia bacterium]|nr:hypothetical protein [Candidatus Saccharimonadia bacterium]